MDGKINTESRNKTFKSLPLVSSPSLSLGLNSLFNSLDDVNKGIFIKVFNFIWGAVNDRKHTNVSFYWAVESLRLSFGLTSSEFIAITYLYQLSHKGANMVHSEAIYFNGVILTDFNHDSKKTLLNTIKRKGYITRHTKDPGQPYSQRAQHNKQPVFIKMTTKGVQVVQNIEKDLNRLLLNISLNDLTGRQ